MKPRMYGARRDGRSEPPSRGMFETRLDRAFDEFIARCPQVWTLFETFTLQAIRAGLKHYSAEAIVQRIRWHVDVDTRSVDGFKINNNHRARLGRLFMQRHPEHAGFFETRRILRISDPGEADAGGDGGGGGAGRMENDTPGHASSS